MLEGGADPDAFVFKGYERARREELSSGATLFSTGEIGEIVPAARGVTSALALARSEGARGLERLLEAKGAR